MKQAKREAILSLADRLGCKPSTRIGMPCCVIIVRETLAEKATRVFAECERILVSSRR